MGAGDPAVPAGGILYKFPYRVLPDLCQEACFIHILNAGDEDPGGPAVVTGYLGLVRHSLYDLVCIFFAMVAVRTVFCEDEPVAHVG